MIADSPRHLQPEDFFRQPDRESQVRFLLRYAILAPSSHNSQPWLFRVRPEAVDLLLNSDKLLPHSDPQRRQAIISIGCALANLTLAARAYGLQPAVSFVLKGDHLATVTISGAGRSPLSEENTALLAAIIARHNNRSLYQKTDISASFSSWLETLNDRETKFFYIDRPEQKQALTETVAHATEAAFRDRKFTGELSRWMRPSLARYQDGLVGSNIGIPFLLSFIVPTLIRKFGLAGQQVKMARAMLEATPAFVIIATKQDRPLDWLTAGQHYGTIAVLAQQNGLATAALAAPIEIGNYWQKLQRALDTDWRPQMFFRIGYPTKQLPPAPRRPLEKVLLID